MTRFYILILLLVSMLDGYACRCLQRSKNYSHHHYQKTSNIVEAKSIRYTAFDTSFYEIRSGKKRGEIDTVIRPTETLLRVLNAHKGSTYRFIRAASDPSNNCGAGPLPLNRQFIIYTRLSRDSSFHYGLCDPPFILEDTTAATGYYSSRTLNDFYYQQHIEALEQLYGKQNGRVKIYAYYLDSDGKYVKKIDVKGRKRNGQFHKKWKVYVPRELLEDRYFKKDFPKGYRLQYYNEGKPIPERKRWFQFNKKKTTIPKSYSQSGSRVKDLASHC